MEQVYCSTYSNLMNMCRVRRLRNSHLNLNRYVLVLADAGEQHPDCGRPLGIRCVNDKYLVVADALLGLLRVDLPLVSEPARVTVLLSAHEEVDNFPLHFLDYPVVFPNGSILVSQVDMFRDFSEMAYTAFEHGPSGRFAFLQLFPLLKHKHMYSIPKLNM